MRSLFLRIFLWFGLAMVLVNVASFALGIGVERRRFQPARTPPFGPMMTLIGHTAVETYERDGQAALRSYLEQVQSRARIRSVLLGHSGEELSGLPQPANSTNVAARVNSSTPLQFELINAPENPVRAPLAAQWLQSPKGPTYKLVALLPPPDFPRPPPRLGEAGSLLFGLRMTGRTLLPLLLVGGLFCYLLARSLAKPIEQLRSTTHELSAGNLTARVDQNLLQRRDEIGELGKDFNLMAGHIESLVDAQRQLITDISHELRSPLARQGVALGLARRRGNEEVVPALDRIAREANRMNEMIGQLLDLSRVESGADSVTPTRIDLAALLEEIVQDADYEARDNGKSVKMIAKENVSVNGAVELLSSAFENVIRNAVRYTNPDTMVQVSLKNGDKSAVVTIRDHGQGVPEESLSSIFRPFYRVEAARDRKSGGAGLGLAIAARAVNLHGGQITAHNAPDGGLTIEIRLPQT